jgi:GNAT superfamily N-acetyltransferase
VITVRPVTNADVPGVVALVRETLAEFGLRFGDGSKTDDELAALPGSYVRGGGAFWVAVDDRGSVVGTCGVFPVGAGDMELRKMYLYPRARGTGLGKRLLDESVAWCAPTAPVASCSTRRSR